VNPVFVTGGTGYLGRPLISALLNRGHAVHALVRRASIQKLPPATVPVDGDALDAASFVHAIPRAATIVHLVGTPHPDPTKAAEFKRVDVGSIMATVAAARRAAARHLVYVSVAHPAPVMKAYIAARQQGEAMIRAAGLHATILRPWYVLGPGHRWPYLLLPLYGVLRIIPFTRPGAHRLGLVTRAQMIAALIAAVEAPPPSSVRIVGVPEIRRSRL
jgi:uncharacterized protein YbjT (DUF2867 family)